MNISAVTNTHQNEAPQSLWMIDKRVKRWKNRCSPDFIAIGTQVEEVRHNVFLKDSISGQKFWADVEVENMLAIIQLFNQVIGTFVHLSFGVVRRMTPWENSEKQYFCFAAYSTTNF